MVRTEESRARIWYENSYNLAGSRILKQGFRSQSKSRIDNSISLLTQFNSLF